MEFSSAIKKIRCDAGMSQDAFAKLLGVSRATINRWEKGSQEPSALAMIILRDYCDAHNISVIDNESPD